MIDFSRIAAAALGAIDQLLAEWLPHGRRDGREYKSLNPTRSDGCEGSFSINLRTGAWADFATDDVGGDLISLYAYLNHLTMGKAARAVAERLGIVELPSHATSGSPLPPADEGKKSRSEWEPILPVPDSAPPPPKAHIKRGRPAATWSYFNADGELLGVVYRFVKSDGGKEILPCVWARNPQSGAHDWRWMAFPEPRTLYGLDKLKPTGKVLIVEGEKCADAARAALGPDTTISVVSWPGGCKAVDKVNWSPLAGRKVILWPDCDAQLDRAGLVLPEDFQPGMKAMARIAALLAALSQPAEVRMVKIPAPGAKPSGWDVADAVAEGWGKPELLDYLKNNLREIAIDPDQAAPGKPKRDADWAKELIRNEDGILKSVVPNAFRFLLHSDEWRGVLAYDEFAGRTIKRAPPPFERGRKGAWEELDDSFTADWLAVRVGLTNLRAPMAAEAVEMVARLNTINPVVDYFDGLKHDGVARVDTWLSAFMGCGDTPYNRIVGRLWLLGMVKRAYEPGCKFDYMPILEGPQGHGKTMALEILASPEWFGNTDFVMGDKDSMAVLQGKLVYEIAELDSFNKADITRVKSFITRVKDEYRPAYGRRFVEQPRRVIFVGTTNQHEYFRDTSGNRRFWPIKVVSQIDVEALRAVRDLLLAEAVALYKGGSRVYPTRDEQKIIDPEQRSRELSDSWEEWIMDYCAKNTFMEISSAEILSEVLKVDRGRVNVSMETKIGIIMGRNGWAKIERRTAAKRYVYRRPQKAEGSTDVEIGVDDVPPF